MDRNGVASLEGQAQGKLKRSWTTLLEDRTQSAKPLIEHLVGLQIKVTELDVAQRVSEVGVVENIESIRTKLESEALPKRKLPADRDVDLGHAEAGNVVSSLGSLPRGGWNLECSRHGDGIVIEHLAARCCPGGSP